MEMSLGPPAKTGQTRLLRPRRCQTSRLSFGHFQTTNQWVSQETEASASRRVARPTRGCSVPALSPEKGKTGKGGGEKAPRCWASLSPLSWSSPWKPQLLQYKPQKPEPLKPFLSPKGTLLERGTLPDPAVRAPPLSHLPREPLGPATSSPEQRPGTPGPWGPG